MVYLTLGFVFAESALALEATMHRLVKRVPTSIAWFASDLVFVECNPTRCVLLTDSPKAERFGASVYPVHYLDFLVAFFVDFFFLTAARLDLEVFVRRSSFPTFAVLSI